MTYHHHYYLLPAVHKKKQKKTSCVILVVGPVRVWPPRSYPACLSLALSRSLSWITCLLIEKMPAFIISTPHLCFIRYVGSTNCQLADSTRTLWSQSTKYSAARRSKWHKYRQERRQYRHHESWHSRSGHSAWHPVWGEYFHSISANNAQLLFL